MPKIDLYLDIKSPPVYLPIQGKENRLFHRPISSAKGTGSLDFLIANALLIVCHSLFKIVVEKVPQRGEIIITLLAVYPVVDSNEVYILLREQHFRVHSNLKVITAEAGHRLLIIYKLRAESSQISLQPNNYHRRSVFTEIFSQALH